MAKRRKSHKRKHTVKVAGKTYACKATKTGLSCKVSKKSRRRGKRK